MFDPHVLGDIIAEARKRFTPRMTQQDLSVYLNKDRSYVSRLENAEVDVKVIELWQIAEALQADPFDWLYMSDPTYLQGISEFTEPRDHKLVSVSELAIEPNLNNG